MAQAPRATGETTTPGSGTSASPRLVPEAAIRSRYRGCLLGGAVGDALGAPVEFMSRAEILERLGSEGVTDFTTAFGRRGAITDDTQMSLFTAEGLLRAHVGSATQGRSDPMRAVAFAYLRWLRTQGTASALLAEDGAESGWLIGQESLHAMRVPGHTCVDALARMRAVGAKARNDSKGCGGVMRSAPLGLFCARMPGASLDRAAHKAVELGVDLAALTHGHPTGQVAAGAFAATIAQVARGESLTAAIDRVDPIVRKRPLGYETSLAIASARRLAADGPATPERLASLGEGWVAEEALSIAIYAALCACDFASGVRLAVNHDGDSDSTGAMTGNLLGATLGVEAIPRRWLAELELGDVIAMVADDLATYPDWPLGEFHPESEASEYWRRRYPA